jgi:segregation and condensation protein A
MAILELAKESMIEIVQNVPLSPIHVRARAALEAGEGDDLDREVEIAGESPFDDDAPGVP